LQSVPLGSQPGELRLEGDFLAGKTAFGCDHLRSRHGQQNLPRLNLIAFRNVESRNNSAVAVLNRLPVARHLYHALGKCTRVQWNKASEGEEQKKEYRGDYASLAQLPSRGILLPARTFGAEHG
jgi:hypothetical protein